MNAKIAKINSTRKFVGLQYSNIALFIAVAISSYQTHFPGVHACTQSNSAILVHYSRK